MGINYVDFAMFYCHLKAFEAYSTGFHFKLYNFEIFIRLLIKYCAEFPIKIISQFYWPFEDENLQLGAYSGENQHYPQTGAYPKNFEGGILKFFCMKGII